MLECIDVAVFLSISLGEFCNNRSSLQWTWLFS